MKRKKHKTCQFHDMNLEKYNPQIMANLLQNSKKTFRVAFLMGNDGRYAKKWRNA